VGFGKVPPIVLVTFSVVARFVDMFRMHILLISVSKDFVG
jgi:hypothetical protein